LNCATSLGSISLCQIGVQEALMKVVSMEQCSYLEGVEVRAVAQTGQEVTAVVLPTWIDEHLDDGTRRSRLDLCRGALPTILSELQKLAGRGATRVLIGYH